MYEIAAIGGAPRLLGNISPQARDLFWSPDGKRIVFSDIPQESTLRHIYELDLTSLETRILTNPSLADGGDSKPIFSPDGKLIAFRRREGRRAEIILLSWEDLQERRLSQEGWGEIRGHDWARDGESLVYSSNRGGQFSLWNLPLEGGAQSKIAINDHWITEPSLARTSNRLIYRKFSDVVNIWSVELDEELAPRGERQRRVPSTRTEFQPAVSPDGKRLAFISNRSGEFEVWSSDLESGRLIQHTQLRGPIPGGPVWSPDGRSLIFDSAASGNGDLYLLRPNSRMPRRLTTNPSDEFNASFSPDGSQLYFTSNRTGQWEIWKMPAAGGEAEQVTETGGFYAQEDLEGKFLYYVRTTDATVWRRPVAGGTGQQLGRTHPYDWAAWDLIEGGAFLVSLTPDGRQLFYAEIEHSDDEVMLVDY